MTLNNQVKEDLRRLTRLCANVTDAHTAAIFLPTSTTLQDSPSLDPLASKRGQGQSIASTAPDRIRRFTTSVTGSSPITAGSARIELKHALPDNRDNPQQFIELAAVQTLSTHIVRESRIGVGAGLLGWVAEHARPIHISPFEIDSSTLGLYTDRESLKSLVALPIPLEEGNRREGSSSSAPCGVLVCDSKKSFSFSKLQMKHLEDLAIEIGRLLFWAGAEAPAPVASEPSWDSFVARTNRLADAIGRDSVDLVRVAIANVDQVEQALGFSHALQRFEQFIRLVQQALPPHFPTLRLPSSELLIAVDNMMSAFFQNKIKSLSDHISDRAAPYVVEFGSYPARSTSGATGKSRTIDFDSVLRHSLLRSSDATNRSSVTVASGGKRA